jgi:hypothetical protein
MSITQQHQMARPHGFWYPSRHLDKLGRQVTVPAGTGMCVPSTVLVFRLAFHALLARLSFGSASGAPRELEALMLKPRIEDPEGEFAIAPAVR